MTPAILLRLDAPDYTGGVRLLNDQPCMSVLVWKGNKSVNDTGQKGDLFG